RCSALRALPPRPRAARASVPRRGRARPTPRRGADGPTVVVMTDPELRARYVGQIRRDGAPMSGELALAFATVPREAFVSDGFQGRDGGWVRPGDRDFLPAVYRDDVLITKVD